MYIAVNGNDNTEFILLIDYTLLLVDKNKGSIFG